MRSTHDDLRGQSILIQVLTSKMLCRRWQRGRACMWISGSRRISSNWQRRSPCGLARYEVSRERLFQGNADLSRAAPPNSDFAYSNARYREIEACWVSDHLCFGTHGGHYGHDLWPLPYTQEALDHVTERIRTVQDFLDRRLVIENPSTYVQFAASTMTEWEFLNALVERTDCGLLLDVNNVYVSAKNHGFDPLEYITGIPLGAPVQLHLAGHLDKGDYLLDNHGSAVQSPVWELYGHVVRRFGHVPCIVEWDENVPELDVLLAESASAARIEGEILNAPERAAS